MNGMTEAEKNGTAIPKKEELIDTAMRVLKKNHNWKLLVGYALGWISVVYIF